MNANIVEIKRFAVHDGDGIRTTVFFKGCPLKCLWCHNPETLSPKRQIAFFAHKCIGCGKCAEVCGCHTFSENMHRVDKTKCTMCGKCTAFCPQSALEIFGTEMSTDEICTALLKDTDFYNESNGGITLSGGECLLQSEACFEILKTMKQNGINTAVDTCGFVPRLAIDKVMPYTDTFLYDIKAIDEDVHIKCTGQSNKMILDNLVYLDSCGAKSEIRIPYIPGCNNGQIDKIGKFLSGLSHVIRVRVLPYHNYAASKYAALNINNTLPPLMPTEKEIKYAETIIFSYGFERSSPELKSLK